MVGVDRLPGQSYACCMALIRNETVIESLAGALQYVSCFHPPEFLAHLAAAYEAEESAAARDAITQTLINSRLAAEGRRPICQDTGLVNIRMAIGMGVRFEGSMMPQALADEAVRRAWADIGNPLRASVIEDPLGDRRNTGNNAPAMLTVEMAAGDGIDVGVMAKGGGAENKARFAVLRPSDSAADWIVETLPTLGAGWCPPGILGVGIGGSSDMAMRLAKESLYDPPDMLDLRARGPASADEAFRLDLFERVNRLGIGAQGLGGLATVLDVKLRTAPTHASALPVALIPQCTATRTLNFHLTEATPFDLAPPSLADYPEFVLDAADPPRRVNLDDLGPSETAAWRAGDRLLLSGAMLTGRDAAHRRLVDLLEAGAPLPVELAGRAIYYTGPVTAAAGEVVGPAGPTTATRMDKFTDRVLEAGLAVMIGKAERGPAAIDAIRRHRAPYLIAVGGAAVLVSRAIKAARVVAFEDLGMEAIHEFTVEDMPVMVAVDADGNSIHEIGPAAWRREG